MEQGILVVAREWNIREPIAPRIASPSVGTLEEVLDRYGGFDGLFWSGVEAGQLPFSLHDGIADLEDIGRVIGFVQATGLGRIDILHVDLVQRGVPSGFRWLGWDIGYIKSEYSHFSALLHEVVWGSSRELRRFGMLLNDAMLLNSVASAKQIISVREHLRSISDPGVENDDVYPVTVSRLDREAFGT